MTAFEHECFHFFYVRLLMLIFFFFILFPAIKESFIFLNRFSSWLHLKRVFSDTEEHWVQFERSFFIQAGLRGIDAS